MRNIKEIGTSEQKKQREKWRKSKRELKNRRIDFSYPVMSIYRAITQLEDIKKRRLIKNEKTYYECNDIARLYIIKKLIRSGYL